MKCREKRKRKKERKRSSSVLMISPGDLSKSTNSTFPYAESPLALFGLWLRGVDPFNCAQIVGYTEISMPTKSGCFSFQVRDFAWNAPAVFLPRSGPQVELDFFIYFFSHFHPGAAGNRHWRYISVTSKGFGVLRHHSQRETSGPILHICKTFLYYHRFTSATHIFFKKNFPARRKKKSGQRLIH